jgi:hypothetical protein
MLLPLLVAANIVLPSAVAPPNDPGFTRCLDPQRGIRLDWEPPPDGVRIYLLVKRSDEKGQWRPWLKTKPAADPSFTLTMQSPLARHSHFAWMLFGVTPEQQIEHSEWRYFCTK